MKAIVLADSNWGIAKNGKQIVYLDEDLRRFKEMTWGKRILFGRRTLESFPNGEPLNGRINICLSTTLEPREGLHVVRTLNELKGLGGLKDLICVGGAQTYRQCYPLFDRIFATRVLRNYRAHQWFPPVDIDPEFERISRSDTYYDEVNDVEYRYEIFTRR